jgi:hypothetical protein
MDTRFEHWTCLGGYWRRKDNKATCTFKNNLVYAYRHDGEGEIEHLPSPFWNFSDAMRAIDEKWPMNNV